MIPHCVNKHLISLQNETHANTVANTMVQATSNEVSLYTNRTVQ